MEEKISEGKPGQTVTFKAPNLSNYNGVDEIEGLTKLFTRPKSAGQYHPAHL